MVAAQLDLTFLELTMWVLRKGIDSLLIKFLMIAWGLWGRRNKMMNKAQHTSPKAAIEQALALLFIFFESSRLPLQKLCSPEEGLVKLNVDDTLFVDLQVIGMGAIVRDSKGEMLLAANKRRSFKTQKLFSALPFFVGSNCA